MNLSYSSALQFTLFSNFTIHAKANLILCILMLFITVVYSLCFYVLIHKYEKKKSAKILILYSKFTQSGFIFEPIFTLTRSLIKSFAHGYLTQSYQYQIVALFILDLPCIALSVYMRKIYRNNFIFAFMTCYFIAFSFLNLFFVL